MRKTTLAALAAGVAIALASQPTLAADKLKIGFLPGVAANMVGLIYIAAGQRRPDDALALLDQAEAIAQASGARGIMRQIEEARAAVAN